MRPNEKQPTHEQALFVQRLDQMLNMGYPLVRLAHAIDWDELCPSGERA